MKIKYELAQLFEADPTWSVSKILKYADEKGQLDQRSLIKVIVLLVAKMEVMEGEVSTFTAVVSEISMKITQPVHGSGGASGGAGKGGGVGGDGSKPTKKE